MIILIKVKKCFFNSFINQSFVLFCRCKSTTFFLIGRKNVFFGGHSQGGVPEGGAPWVGLGWWFLPVVGCPGLLLGPQVWVFSGGEGCFFGADLSPIGGEGRGSLTAL